MSRQRAFFVGTALVALLALLAGCGGSSGTAAAGGKVTIGSKDFTENIVVGEMLAQLIEGNTKIKVERKLSLGGTTVVFQGVKNNNLDLYTEYDGTAYSVHLAHKEPIANPDQLFTQVKQEFEQKHKLTWSKPLGFNNTYALAIPKKLAEQYQIKTYSDLAKHSDQFVLGTTNEFIGRKADGYEPLVKAYGFKFKDVKKMTSGLRYKAMQQNEIQVMDAYTTDGKLKEFNLAVLQDDKKFFPPYHAAVVMRMDTLQKNPGLLDAVDKLGGTLSDQTMQDLNYRVDVKGESVETVAKSFLQSKGLIK